MRVWPRRPCPNHVQEGPCPLALHPSARLWRVQRCSHAEREREREREQGGAAPVAESGPWHAPWCGSGPASRRGRLTGGGLAASHQAPRPSRCAGGRACWPPAAVSVPLAAQPGWGSAPPCRWASRGAGGVPFLAGALAGCQQEARRCRGVAGGGEVAALEVWWEGGRIGRSGQCAALPAPRRCGWLGGLEEEQGRLAWQRIAVPLVGSLPFGWLAGWGLGGPAQWEEVVWGASSTSGSTSSWE